MIARCAHRILRARARKTLAGIGRYFAWGRHYVFFFFFLDYSFLAKGSTKVEYKNLKNLEGRLPPPPPPPPPSSYAYGRYYRGVGRGVLVVLEHRPPIF